MGEPGARRRPRPAARLVQAGLLLLLGLALLLHAHSYREEACGRLRGLVASTENGMVLVVNNLSIPVVAYTGGERVVIEPGGSAWVPRGSVLDACLSSCIVELGCRVRATSGPGGPVGGE